MPEEYVRSINLLSYPMNRGNVICFDNIEDTLKWKIDATGADYTAEKSTDWPYDGVSALHLKPRASDAAANDYVDMKRYIALQQNNFIRVQLLLSFLSTTSKFKVQVQLVHDDLTNIHLFGLEFDGTAQTVAYKDSTGSFVASGISSFIISQYSWINIDFMIDLVNHSYKHFRFAGQEASIAGESYFVSGSTSSLLSYLQLVLTATDTDRPEICVDSVLITR